jgi:hypothetical protein
LVPFPGEWQVWWFQHTEVIAYASFAAFLESRGRYARGVVAGRTQRIAAGVHRSWLQEVEDLASQGDSRAADVATGALDHDPVGAAVWLRQIGSPRAIPALPSAYARQTGDRERTLILLALDSCGDPAIIDELGRVIAAGGSLSSFAARTPRLRDTLPRW